MLMATENNGSAFQTPDQAADFMVKACTAAANEEAALNEWFNVLMRAVFAGNATVAQLQKFNAKSNNLYRLHTNLLNAARAAGARGLPKNAPVPPVFGHTATVVSDSNGVPFVLVGIETADGVMPSPGVRAFPPGTRPSCPTPVGESPGGGQTLGFIAACVEGPFVFFGCVIIIGLTAELVLPKAKELLQTVFSKARVAEIESQMQEFAGKVEARRLKFVEDCVKNGGKLPDCERTALALREKSPGVSDGHGFFFWAGVFGVLGGAAYGVYRWRKRGAAGDKSF